MTGGQKMFPKLFGWFVVPQSLVLHRLLPGVRTEYDVLMAALAR